MLVPDGGREVGGMELLTGRLLGCEYGGGGACWNDGCWR